MARSGRYGSRSRADAADRQRRIAVRCGQGVVVLVGLSSGTLSFVRSGVTPAVVAIVVLAVLLGFSVSANVAGVLAGRAARRRPRRIAFLTPSSGGQTFYGALLGALVKNASLAVGQDYVVVPSVPPRSFETVSIWSLFAGLEDRQGDIDGIIFVPDRPDDHFEELVEFHEKRGDVPLVLVDVFFDYDRCDARTRRRLPSFVGGDEKAGGVLAAEIATGAVSAARRANPVAMIVNGGQSPWERQRAAAFRGKLSENLPGVRFVESPPIDYHRHSARQYVLRQVRASVAADPGAPVALDVVFACNDDMAVGVRSAISTLVRDGVRFLHRPQIVGYDGTDEIREYLSAQDQYIAGTVDVRVDQQAQAAMLLMHKLIRSGERVGEVKLTMPRKVERA